MKFSRLTPSGALDAGCVESVGSAARSRQRGVIALAMLIVGSAMMAGCLSISAPDKPIVIELNINIKQEVIYRLAEDVKQNIDANPDIF